MIKAFLHEPWKTGKDLRKKEKIKKFQKKCRLLVIGVVYFTSSSSETLKTTKKETPRGVAQLG